MSRDALIVGINTYQHLRSLTAPANDAEAIAQLLSQDKHFLVRRLPEYLDPFEGNLLRIATSAEVNKTALEDAILQLFLPQSERLPQTALFYFSGHGLRKERGITEGFLVTSDVNPNEDRWGISLKWLREILKQSQVPQQIVWLDCCYAAEFFNYEEANPKGRDRGFIAAAREFEESWQDASNDYSAMTRVIVQGLNPQYQPDGLVDNYRLVALISQTLKEGKQRPVFFNVGEPILLLQSHSGRTPEPTVKLQPEVCPYRGLAAFDSTEEDVRFFFGRTALTDELLDAIWQQNFLAVLGPSGSGKSSVARAGLIHAIQQGEKRDTKQWHILPVIKPGEHPLTSLAEAFVPNGLTVRQKERTRQNYIQSLQEKGAIALAELVADYAPDPVLLVIDQFEEVFTLCQDDEKRQQFLACLMGALNGSLADHALPLRVVITMRADFFGKCLEQDYNGLADQIKTNIVPITPLNSDELRSAIIQPAAQVGLQLEPELVQQMIVDVQHSPGSLPLLQYVLTELWEQWHQVWQQNGTTTGNTLTLNGYTETGGVRGALEKQANKVYNNLSEIEQTVAKRIFLELTQLGEGTEDTRRRITKQMLINDQHLEALLNQVIHKLTNARLIVTDEQMSGKASVVVLDVAHEALIRYWTQLRQWVDADRDALRTERKLKTAAQEWQEKGQQVEYLWLGARLAEAEEMYQQSLQLGRLDYIAQDFVQASRMEQDRLEQEKDEQIRTLKRALAESKLREQAAKIVSLLPVQPIESITLALQTLALNLEEFPGDLLGAVQDSLHRAVQVTFKHEAGINSVAFSPDGQLIASGSSDKTIRLWDLRANPISQPFEGHKSRVTSVDFAPNGEMLASGSVDRTIRLWDLQGNLIVEPFKGHTNEITCVAFSPDGRLIASSSVDKTIRLWDLQGRTTSSPVIGHDVPVVSVRFSPDGQRIASGGSDGTIRIWGLQGNQIGQPFLGHTGEVRSIAFNPDGQRIASGGSDGTIRIWDSQGSQISCFQGHQDWVTSVTFSPDGQMIISGGIDKTIRLWDLNGNQLLHLSQENEDLIFSVALSPDGQTIAANSRNRTVRLWNTSGSPIDQSFVGHENFVFSAEFSPDSKTIVSAGTDNTVRLWDLQGNALAAPFYGHQSAIYSIRFSPDGQRIISASRDKTLRLWNLRGNTVGQPFQGHKDSVSSAIFSPDGQLIASAGWDETICLWNLQGNLICSPFQGHEGWVNSVVFSPCGRIIASCGSDKTIRLWDLYGNSIGKPFKGHKGTIWDLAFNPNGKLIASCSEDKSIQLWDLQGNPIAEPFTGHESSVSSVKFGPDGTLLVSSSSDSTIRLWDLGGNSIGEPLRKHEGRREVNSVAFSPDGKLIVSASGDKTIQLWPAGNWKDWLKICCDRLAYHLISKDPEIDIAQTACAVCIQHAWSSTDLAQILKRQGNDLARQGQTDLALIKFQQAASSDPCLIPDPEAEVSKWSNAPTNS